MGVSGHEPPSIHNTARATITAAPCTKHTTNTNQKHAAAPAQLRAVLRAPRKPDGQQQNGSAGWRTQRISTHLGSSQLSSSQLISAHLGPSRLISGRGGSDGGDGEGVAAFVVLAESQPPLRAAVSRRRGRSLEGEAEAAAESRPPLRAAVEAASRSLERGGGGGREPTVTPRRRRGGEGEA